jgi:hypothetical protein
VRRPATALAAYAVALFVALVAAVMLTPGLRAWSPGEEDASIILFLGFLPLLNAAADFASTGLTRWWLRKGVQGHLLRNALWDAGAAIGILFLLGFAMIATIHFVRPQDGRALADLPSIFADLRGPEAANYYWCISASSRRCCRLPCMAQSRASARSP